MPTRQTRVFVASNEPLNDWAETIIGRVIVPITRQFSGQLNWFWFSRYISPINDSGDCDVSLIPAPFLQPLSAGGQPQHRSVRFRFDIVAAGQPAFESQLQALILQHGYAVSDIRDYDFVGDTGGHRFLGDENRQPGRDVQRAHLVTNYYQSISALVVDALVGPDVQGRFRLETNSDQQNPHGSTFESLHHLFCNITQPPLTALVYQDPSNNQLALGSRWIPQRTPPFNLLGELPVRY